MTGLKCVIPIGLGVGVQLRTLLDDSVDLLVSFSNLEGDWNLATFLLSGISGGDENSSRNPQGGPPA